MDTEAIYSAVCDYGKACRQRDEMDQFEHLSSFRFLLTEAEKEHKSLLAENERLVDEVGEQARLNGVGAEREVKLLARISWLEKALRELHDATQLVSVGNYNQEAHDIAVSRALAALEKKHEST